MKNKMMILIFMAVFAILIINMNSAYADDCDISPTTSVLYSTPEVADNAARSIAKELDKLTEQIETREANLEKMRALQRDAGVSEKAKPIRDENIKIEVKELEIQKAEQAELKRKLKEAQAEAERLRTEALRQRLSTAAGSLGVYRETYDKLSWTNYYIDKWGWMGEWKSIVDKTFAASLLGIEPITSHLCDLWTVGTDSTSNVAFGEDGAASAHVEGVVVKTAEDNPVSGGAPVEVLQHRVTFFVSSSVLLSPSSAATVQVNLYSAGTKAKELGSYKLGEDVSQIGAQGDNTLIASGGVYDLVCLRFLEMWRYKGDFRTFLDKCPDKSGDCLCNRFGASGNALPGGSWAVPGK